MISLSDPVAILESTLRIIRSDRYTAGSRTSALPLSFEEMQDAQLFLPSQIQETRDAPPATAIARGGRCVFSCRNMDSFASARDLTYSTEGKKPVLVLNFANALYPGGGVRAGVNAQEEDLCRKSSLLLSLESEKASAYYAYNKTLDPSALASDAVLVSPHVLVIRDSENHLLDSPFEVAVMTCAAPYMPELRGIISDETYRHVMLNRMDGMLTLAAALGYDRFVLGAWGCGVFENDPLVVADLFFAAFRQFSFAGLTATELFSRIDFAILVRDGKETNFRAFQRYFSTDRFYSYENVSPFQDAIRGCLTGGAAGDALGYPVEFLSEKEIIERYGQEGISCYDPDKESKKALISDDTQMTLFTANALVAHAVQKEKSTSFCLAQACLDWLRTQDMPFDLGVRQPRLCWLLDVPALYARRAPGRTCLSALRFMDSSGEIGSVDHPVNQSKGCGGVMRAAPVGLVASLSLDEAVRLGADAAAITHSHPLGYLPAAFLAGMVHEIVFGLRGQSLKEIQEVTAGSVSRVFEGTRELEKLLSLLDLAVSLSGNTLPDASNIPRLGEGWVGEEALAIALYSVLRYPDNFSRAITTAVNHSGDSDSTGAIAGNILGAYLGYHAIPEEWKQDLELSDVVLQLSDDLAALAGPVLPDSRAWHQKYHELHCAVSPEHFLTCFELVLGDITQGHGTQAIVSDARTNLLGEDGIDGAIHAAAGPELAQACRKLSGCEAGHAKITGAFHLPCSYVIHTPTPAWRKGKKHETETLAHCYLACMEICRENGIRTIAFPPLGTGRSGFPVREAAETAVQTLSRFTTLYPEAMDAIKFIISDPAVYQVYADILLQMKSL